MTNEEKAREILGCNFWIDNVGTQTDTLARYIDLNKMAEWKDNAIRDVIKKEIDRANRYYEQKLSTTQMVASVRVVQVLSELIGEKFPYEELHMGFATMD